MSEPVQEAVVWMFTRTWVLLANRVERRILIRNPMRTALWLRLRFLNQAQGRLTASVRTEGNR